MRVVGAELREVRLTLRDVFATGAGVRSERRILLLRVRGDEGMEGWGECVAGETPAYSPETTDSAWGLLSDVILPSVVGREILAPEEILAPVGWVQGHPMAKATLEMALWDLEARESGVPLWELLGGSGAAVPVACVVGLQPSAEVLLDRIGAALAAGYAAVKLKIEPGQEESIAGTARERFPDAPLAVDANGAYAEREGRGLEALDRLGLLWIEQPLGRRDFLGHARLQGRLRTPICLDESIGSPEELELALELGSCRAVSVKPGQVGGHRVARQLHDLCLQRGMPIRCGGMLESGIGRAHNLCLATLPGFTLPGDISESRRYWEQDLVIPEFELSGGRMVPLSLPGIGVALDDSRIHDLTVRQTTYGFIE